MSAPFPADLLAAAEVLLASLRARRLKLVTAESCTGGLVAGVLTEIAGSSDVVERGFVTYSNDAKTDCLGVPATLIAEHGAVSAEVARAMAEGALAHAPADVAVSVTGVAGPGGGTAAKPVGLVYLAARAKGGRTAEACLRLPASETRAHIRLASVRRALELIGDVTR